jgi:plastocyanin
LAVGVVAAWAFGFQGCAGEADHDLRPDSLLRAELGLTDQDRVHRVGVAGGAQETLSTVLVEASPGDWVEFATLDWWVHEVRFEADSLSPDARSFLERTDQMASPPLVNQDDRFVLSLRDAPEGRYPFVVEGNGAPARGVVVVGPRR